ncbi:probable RNA-binding protein 46 isoform X2 [Nematostella vectensis]|uniref:probable RNA-binding protein 46 isoform X2 n=1 Tax=Nematostella vectensis TaxID=45351 RepID=UPI0013904418|nr:probable RNA-binding protein 46 isoform X2 [Nematostella vectensis]
MTVKKLSEEMAEDLATNMEESGPEQVTDGVTGTPKEAALRALMERTKFPIRQCNGQRRYGPPPGWDRPIPPRGCEVFVGKIPRDLYEDELVPVFETAGPIYEVRLMMDFNGQNRGYAFVVYTSKDDAKRCVKTLNNYEIRKGKCIGVCSSVDNCRLFVGGIPKKVKKDEIMAEVSKVTDNVVDVIVYPSAQDKTKNRGFAFVEYISHRDAAMARRKLMTGKIQLWGHQIAVDWAEPEQEVDQEIMDQVKVLYARNLLLSTTEETIEQAFSKFGEVERVKKIKDYCFIHFRTKEQARDAMEAMNETELDGNEIEVTLAKPVDKDHRQAKAAAKAMMTYNFVPSYDYSPALAFPGYAPAQYIPFQNSLVNGVGPGIGRAAAATPSFGGAVRPRGRGRSAAGSRSAGNKYYFPGSPLLFRGYYGTPSMRPGFYGDYKKSQEILEDVCQKNQWGSPVYTLHSTLGPQEVQLFLYKVSIPGLATQYQPPKLCRTVEEAKNYAAEHTLQQLGISLEASDIPVTSGAPVPTTVAYQARPMAPGPAYSIHNNGLPVTSADTASYPAGFVSITQAPPSSPGTAVVAKMWPAGGVPPSQDGNIYSGYEGYQEQQPYPQNVYQY